MPTRLAWANDRVQTNAAGQVVSKLNTSYREGGTHLVLSQLEFMQRLIALTQRPSLHLIRFHRVLAHNAKLRALVVPQEGAARAQTGGPEIGSLRVRSELRLPPPGAAKQGQAADAGVRS